MADDSVEFIDEPGEPGESSRPAAGRPGADSSRMFAAIAAACWLAGAALTIVAPFHALYRENMITGSPDSFNGTPDATLSGFDGWGRSLIDGDPAGNGAQFGIALVGCAALLLILPSVLWYARARAPHAQTARRVRRMLTFGSVGVAGLLVGVAGVLALYVGQLPTAAAGGFTAYAPLPVSLAPDLPLEPTSAGAYSSTLSFSPSAGLSTSAGGCVWLALAAAACAVLAAAAVLYAYHRAAPARGLGESGRL